MEFPFVVWMGFLLTDRIIYMLEDAQCRYNNFSFLDVVIKDAPLYFDAGVGFITSATHDLINEALCIFEHLKRSVEKICFCKRNSRTFKI
jgi:hypothetical protein